MTSAGIYSAPAARVADPSSGEYSQINVWSAKGRLGRARYIAYSIGFGLLTNMVGKLFITFANQYVGVLLFFVALAAGGCIQVLLSVQRAHDFNTTGWLAVLGLIPLLNFILWFMPGTPSENRFGKQTPPNTRGVLIAAWIVPAVMIIGILAAIAIPTYQGYVERARSSQSG